MTRRSLQFRLLLAAAVSISLALAAAGVGLSALFERHVTRYQESRLADDLDQILGSLDFGPDDHIHLARTLSDPRFQTPLSGLYWQIQDESQALLLRSRSLWDTVLDLPGNALPDGVLHRHRLDGPDGQSLLVLERKVLFQPQDEARTLRVAVALDRRDLDQLRREFARDMLPYLLILGGALVLAAWVQVRVGLSPLDALRKGVRLIRSGESQRLPLEYPDEVMPLVEEVNGLLDAQDGAMERARTWTADLAHGLKTPLMSLAVDAERLRQLGQTDLAQHLDQLAQTMRRRVDRELIRGRVRARAQQSFTDGCETRGVSSHVGADLGTVLESILRTLVRMPRGERIDWELDCPFGVRVALLTDDLTELLGNVLENAAQWARARVLIQVDRAGSGSAGTVLLRVQDDGPGVPAQALSTLGQRGLRLDERTQGAGLGLAIALDICDAYGAGLTFGSSPLGGLLVDLRLPSIRDGVFRAPGP